MPSSRAPCGPDAPVDTLVSNWAYMVMTALAWNLKAWWALWPRARDAGRSDQRGASDGAADGVQDVRQRVRAVALSDYSSGSAANLSRAQLESLAEGVLPHLRAVAALTRVTEAGVWTLRSAAALLGPAGQEGT